jgi:hypothetical protein
MEAHRPATDGALAGAAPDSLQPHTQIQNEAGQQVVGEQGHRFGDVHAALLNFEFFHANTCCLTVTWYEGYSFCEAIKLDAACD